MSRTSICNILRQNNLDKSYKKVSQIKYNYTNNSTCMDKKVSQIKPIKIIKIKYSDNNNSTHMDKKEFYLRHYEAGNIENFYLSNGCNKTFSSGGGGTNAAITKISPEFFNIKKINLIYNNNLDLIYNNNLDLIKKKIYSSEQQKMKFNGKKLNAGSVLFSYYEHSFTGHNFKRSYNIQGVYHINAVDWTHIEYYEDMIDNTNIVKKYYIKIINHFIENSLDNSLLFLAQIPGFHFKGGQGTINGINSAIEEIENKYLTDKNLTILFDL